MKMNGRYHTTKLTESKAFYTKILVFGVTFENDFYLLLHTPGGDAAFSFLLPNHASQQSLFHKPFAETGSIPHH